MKKIVIWYTGNRCAMWHKWLMNYFNVVCFVQADSSVASIKEKPVIEPNQVKTFEYDAIVVVTNNKESDSLKKASECSGYPEKVYWLDDFLSLEGLDGRYQQDYYEMQISIIKDILNASDDQITDFDWMYSKVISYGIFCFEENWMEQDSSINWSFCGMQQIPEEFAEYCIKLSDVKVKNAIDIGVYRGRTSFFICAVLMRNNPEMTYLLVDIDDKLDHYEEYAGLLPSLRKSIPSTSKDYLGTSFDYVFIDADHSYDASISDYENVGKNAKVIVAFHDIYAHEYAGENGGTVRMWREVMEREQGNKIFTFSKYPDRWMGIGAVIKK